MEREERHSCIVGGEGFIKLDIAATISPQSLEVFSPLCVLYTASPMWTCPDRGTPDFVGRSFVAVGRWPLAASPQMLLSNLQSCKFWKVLPTEKVSQNQVHEGPTNKDVLEFLTWGVDIWV